MKNPVVIKFLIYFFLLYPLYGYFAFTVIGSAPVNITGSMMLLLTLFILIHAKYLKFERFLLFYLLFWIYSTVLNRIKLDEEVETFKFLYSNIGLHFLIFLFIIQLDIYKMRINLRLINRILIVLVIISAIVMIIQQNYPTFLVNPEYTEAWMETESGKLFNVEALRSPSIFSWSQGLTIGLIFIPFVTLVVNYYLIRNKNRIAYFFLFLGLLVAVLSKGRWIMINAVVIFAMILHYSKLKFGRKIQIAVILLIALIGVYYFMPIIGINVRSLIAYRILETSSGGLMQGSASTRILAFQVFFKLFPQNPVFGVGDQRTDELIRELAGRSSQIHVGYLSLFYFYGFIGGVLYLAFIYYFTRMLYRNAKIHGYYGPFYAWLGFLLANLTLVYLVPFDAGILLALLLDKYYLIAHREKIIKLSLQPVPDRSGVISNMNS